MKVFPLHSAGRNGLVSATCTGNVFTDDDSQYKNVRMIQKMTMLDKTLVFAHMQGKYNFIVLSDDGATPVASAWILPFCSSCIGCGVSEAR